MNSQCSWPKLVTIVSLNYLFIPKNFFFFLYLFAHWFFCVFKKLFGFFYSYFIILFVKGIGYYRNIKKQVAFLIYFGSLRDYFNTFRTLGGYFIFFPK
jgi:Ulp1 family protease